MFCFFFQAEDGIRDLTVTGVQTCALPIYQLPDIKKIRPDVAGVHSQVLQDVLKRVDRKSTRLNSSHSQISYAVFCLKKKKKKVVLNTLVLTLTCQQSCPNTNSAAPSRLLC